MNSKKVKGKAKQSAPSDFVSDQEKTGEWIAKMSTSKDPGRIYYVNKRTREMRWSPPPIDNDSDVDNCRVASNSKNHPNPALEASAAATSKNGPIHATESSNQSQRKPSSVSKDLLEGCSNDFGRGRPRQKRARVDGEIPTHPMPSAAPVSFNFKLPSQSSFGYLPPVEPPVCTSTPMDTSFSSMPEDEDMAPVPAVINQIPSGPNREEAVEYMEIDEFVQDVNMIRRGGGSQIPMVQDFGCNWETFWTAETVGRSMMIIVDTNVLLSDLSFLRDLTNYHKYGSVRLVVPYVVIRELDYLKVDRSFSTRKETSDNARAAINWILEQLRSGTRNVIFQPSVADQSSSSGFEITCNDDRVLNCAMVVLQRYPNGEKWTTILCTNDKNLLNKAKIHGVCSGSKKDLQSYLRRMREVAAVPTQRPVLPQYAVVMEATSAGVPVNAEMPVASAKMSRPTAIVPAYKEEAVASRNEASTELEEILESCRACLCTLAEIELKSVYDSLWMDIVKIKPPWTTLAVVLELYLQHWMAVFGMICGGKEMEKPFQDLLKDARHGANFGFGEVGRSMLSSLLDVFSAIARKKKEYRPHIKTVYHRIQQFLSSEPGRQ